MTLPGVSREHSPSSEPAPPNLRDPSVSACTACAPFFSKTHCAKRSRSPTLYAHAGASPQNSSQTTVALEETRDRKDRKRARSCSDRDRGG